MDDQELVKSLSPTGKPRATLYLAQEKVEQLYVQSVALVTEFVRSAKQGGRLSASLLKIIGAEVSEEETLSAKIHLGPLLQAILIENAGAHANALLDLSLRDAEAGTLLKYVGDARIAVMDMPVLPSKSVTERDCEVITRERETQEKVLRFRDDKVGTIVLTASPRGAVLASIASTESTNLNFLASYSRNPPFGILGRMENRIEDVTFISPLWVWREGW